MSDEELRRLAQEAPPGPWWVQRGSHLIRDVVRSSKGAAVARPEMATDLIAAANPATVLSLLERLKKAEAMVGQARAALEAVGDVPTASLSTDRDEVIAEMQGIAQKARRALGQ